MEQLNKIELRGNVGNIRISEAGESHVARFSLATNYMYKNRNGEAVVETTWHNIVAWEGKGMPNLEKIRKGCTVYVCGRVRQARFTGNDGEERQVFEVIAGRLQIEEPDKETA